MGVRLKKELTACSETLRKRIIERALKRGRLAARQKRRILIMIGIRRQPAYRRR
jgi:hypothetical protein